MKYFVLLVTGIAILWFIFRPKAEPEPPSEIYSHSFQKISEAVFGDDLSRSNFVAAQEPHLRTLNAELQSTPPSPAIRSAQRICLLVANAITLTKVAAAKYERDKSTADSGLIPGDGSVRGNFFAERTQAKWSGEMHALQAQVKAELLNFQKLEENEDLHQLSELSVEVAALPQFYAQAPIATPSNLDRPAYGSGGTNRITSYYNRVVIVNQPEPSQGITVRPAALPSPTPTPHLYQAAPAAPATSYRVGH